MFYFAIAVTAPCHWCSHCSYCHHPNALWCCKQDYCCYLLSLLLSLPPVDCCFFVCYCGCCRFAGRLPLLGCHHLCAPLRYSVADATAVSVCGQHHHHHQPRQIVASSFNFNMPLRLLHPLPTLPPLVFAVVAIARLLYHGLKMPLQ